MIYCHNKGTLLFINENFKILIVNCKFLFQIVGKILRKRTEPAHLNDNHFSITSSAKLSAEKVELKS